MSAKKLPFLILTLAAFGFASCGNKGAGNGGDETGKPATATVIYRFDAGADFLKLFNVEVRYTDAYGQTVTEKAASLPWEKNLAEVDLPYTATMTVIPEPTEGYAEKDKYEVGYGLSISYQTSDGRRYDEMSMGKVSVGKDKVEKYRESVISRNLTTKTEIPLKSE